MSKSTKPETAPATDGEQDKQPQNTPTAAPATDDPWAAALAEQAATPADANPEKPAATVRSAGNDVFQPLGEDAASVSTRDLDMIMDIPVKLSVELGRTRLTIKQLLELAQGSVVELDGLPGEPMDILINGYLVAQGEVVVIDDKFGIRVTEIITPAERLARLNR